MSGERLGLPCCSVRSWHDGSRQHGPLARWDVEICHTEYAVLRCITLDFRPQLGPDDRLHLSAFSTFQHLFVGIKKYRLPSALFLGILEPGVCPKSAETCRWQARQGMAILSMDTSDFNTVVRSKSTASTDFRKSLVNPCLWRKGSSLHSCSFLSLCSSWYLIPPGYRPHRTAVGDKTA